MTQQQLFSEPEIILDAKYTVKSTSGAKPRIFTIATSRNGHSAGSRIVRYYPRPSEPEAVGTITADNQFLAMAAGRYSCATMFARWLVLQLAAGRRQTPLYSIEVSAKKCFLCGRPLTDERSTRSGLGSTCAGKLGLDWKKPISPDDLRKSLEAIRSSVVREE